MGLAYRGEYHNPFVIELELEQIDARISYFPRKLTTTQRDALPSVTEGTVVYNLTTHKLNVYNGTTWRVVTDA